MAATLRQLGPLLAAAAAVAMTATATAAQEAARPTKEELDAITERGRMLYEYDQAAWHASDSVQTANPKTVEGQRYIARKENGRWGVVFGKLNEERSRFGIIYEAMQKEEPREFTVRKEPAEWEDDGFFLFAARAIEAAIKDFAGATRPYNVAVLPATAGQLYVYLYPAQTKPRVYPLGADARYLVSADGMTILEKRQMHKSILETAAPPKGKKAVAGFHAHVLSNVPEDTDVFHVLTQDPPLPEFVGAGRFVYQVMTDGTIKIEKGTKTRK
jgi:hypothetical protein